MAQTAVPNKNSRILMMAAIAVVIASLYFAKEVLIPVALAIMLSFLMAPLVTRVQRLKVRGYSPGRVPAVIAVVVMVLGAFGGLGYIVWGQVNDLADKLPQYQANMEEKVTWLRKFTSGGALDKGMKAIENSIEGATSKPTKVPGAATATDARPAVAITQTPDGRPALVAPDPDKPANPIPVVIKNEPTGSAPFKNLYQSLAPLIDPLATLGLVAILMIFMLVAREDMRDRVIRLIGQGRINLTTQAMDEAAKRISKYLIAQCIVNGSYGAAVGAGLWVIGLTFGHGGPSFPNFFLWGVLTGVLRFIPYIGPWIGAAFPMIISLAVYHGMAVPLAVLGLILLLELVSNNWMEPWLYGSSTGVSEVAILVAAVFWAWLWGTPGLLLATPLTTIIVVMGKYVPQLEFLNILLGSEPALEPKYRFYQRLLAEDTEEAEDLIAEYVAERPIVQVYDQVVLPALGLAEADRHRDRLDPAKQAQIRADIRGLIDEMAEAPPSADGAKARPRPAPAAANGKAATAAKPKIVDAVCADVEPTADVEAVTYDRPILCLAARDEADEIAGMMLTQLLDRRGYRAEYVSVEKLASEYVQLVEDKGAQVVFVSALPPAAVTHARYIVKRLRARLPNLKIIVGLWTVCGDIKRSRERLAAAGTDLVVCSLEAAVEQLRQVVAPLVLTAEVERKEEAAAVG